jgi:hypothetical protein
VAALLFNLFVLSESVAYYTLSYRIQQDVTGKQITKKVQTGIRPNTGNGTSVVLAQLSGGKLKSIQPTETPAAETNDLL